MWSVDIAGATVGAPDLGSQGGVRCFVCEGPWGYHGPALSGKPSTCKGEWALHLCCVPCEVLVLTGLIQDVGGDLRTHSKLGVGWVA